ncbi:hypothetical protein F6X40_23965 [Paraburkholderia sp. UCT31]|uniref:hypothetical protein n=1 Tax=Paraburkholderia sp. UCT31 TaxID=2615209 RepID=UPI001654F7EF|nr:hypothetical protein [Paraburkholderia sp. UCT31]MBC8739773.1 hypothetical protein [Paraburkholderia sp. UCT31]
MMQELQTKNYRSLGAAFCQHLEDSGFSRATDLFAFTTDVDVIGRIAELAAGFLGTDSAQRALTEEPPVREQVRETLKRILPPEYAVSYPSGFDHTVDGLVFNIQTREPESIRPLDIPDDLLVAERAAPTAEDAPPTHYYVLKVAGRPIKLQVLVEAPSAGPVGDASAWTYVGKGVAYTGDEPDDVLDQAVDALRSMD